MKKSYIFSCLFIVFVITIIIFIKFNYRNQELNLDIDIDIDKNDENITFGDFLKAIITESINNIDYDLIVPSVDHDEGIYLTVAENYGIIEKNTIIAEALDKPIKKLDAYKICALCDINIRQNEKKILEEPDELFLNNLSKLDNSLIMHVIANKWVENITSDDFLSNVYLTNKNAVDILIKYKNSP